MAAPSIVRRLRTSLEGVQARRLRVQLAKEQDRNRCLEQRVADLQAANEGAYHALSIERGVVCARQNCPRCAALAKAGSS